MTLQGEPGADGLDGLPGVDGAKVMTKLIFTIQYVNFFSMQVTKGCKASDRMLRPSWYIYIQSHFNCG